MKYTELQDFVQNRMRMSHVYQPVMLMTLIKDGSTRPLQLEPICPQAIILLASG